MTTDTFDDPADLEDQAAERDDDNNDPAGDDAGADPHVPLNYYAGLVETGPEPYTGRLLISRYPAGVLLIDRPGRLAWLLDFDPDGGTYRSRTDVGMALDDAARWRAAEGPDFEVRAFDPDFDGDEPPGDGVECDQPGCDDDGDAP